MTVAKFDPTGRLVFVGTSAGTLLVFNTRTKQVRVLYQIPFHMFDTLSPPLTDDSAP